MQKAIMRIIGFAIDAPCPMAGQWLKYFNHDTADGLGFGEFSADPTQAMKFDSAAELMAFWTKVSATKPVREDGKPNRPLTCVSVTIDYIEG